MEEPRKSKRPNIRSQKSMVEQQVTLAQVKEIIENALKPIRDTLEELPDKSFLDDAVNKVKGIFDGKLVERDNKMKSLEERIEKLESSLAVVQRLESKIDNEEQYSRRQCLRFQ